MTLDNWDMEAHLRAALQDEAGELWPPSTLWPRVQARLTRPVEGTPPLVRPQAELRRLLRRDDLRRLTLALLAERELDAFALARRIEDVAWASGRLSPREGSTLPVLHLLERDGLVEARWTPGPRGLRRAYALSVRGRRVRRTRSITVWLAQLGRRLGGLVPRRAAQHG